MIKLIRGNKPAELTMTVQKDLTDKYKLDKSSVWKQTYIEEGLLAYSNDKCCYCEAIIDEESKYMEVEHFQHKDSYPDFVVEWDNLLPSCKRCNGTKSSHDVNLEPIIEPTKTDPRLHLRLWNYRLKSPTVIGAMTISTLDLNNQERVVLKRASIGNAICEKTEFLNNLLDEFISGSKSSTRTKNRIVNGTKDLLREGLPKTSYSATTATIIMHDQEFIYLKNKLLSEKLWDQELSDLEDEVYNITLDQV